MKPSIQMNRSKKTKPTRKKLRKTRKATQKNRGKSSKPQNAPPGIASASTLAAFHAEGGPPWSFAEGR